MGVFQRAAPDWIAAGIAALPVDPDSKCPMVKHPGKFGRRAALQIVPKFPDANLGFWCGSHNGLTVVDIDSPADAELQFALNTFGDSPIIEQTPSGGHHIFYRHASERRGRPDKSRPIDILGNGLCIASPSRFATGAYRFVRGGLADLRTLPTIRAGALPSSPAKGVQNSSVLNAAPVSDMARIEKGQRNSTLFRLGRSLGFTAASHADLLAQMRQMNAGLMNPPLPDPEVLRMAGIIWGYRERGMLMVSGSGSALIMPSAKPLLGAGETDKIREQQESNA